MTVVRTKSDRQRRRGLVPMAVARAGWRGALFAVLALGMLLSGCARPPDLVTLDGRGHRLADHAGQWVVLNYWAQWCAPCRHEIPELNALFKARGRDVAVYGVNYDGVSGTALQQQAAAMGIEFPVLASDPGQALGITRPEVLPTTILIAPSGRRTQLIGPQTQRSLDEAIAATK